MPEPRFGPYLGTVRDNRDPAQRGRLRILVPVLNARQILPVWVPMLGQSFGASEARASARGSFVVPEIGATVAVWCLDGDVEKPVWMPGPLLDAEVDPAVKSSATATRDPYPKKALLARGRALKVLEKARGELELTSNGATATIDADGAIELTTHGAMLTINADGSIAVDAAPGKRVALQGAPHGATQAFLRGDDYTRDLGTFLDALETVEGALAAALGAVNTWAMVVQPLAEPANSATPTLTTALTTTLTAAMTLFSTAKATFRTSLATHLSTRIKGE